MESLPKDVLEKSFSFLEMKDLCMGVELVCKSFREVSIKSDKNIWRAIALRKYGSKIIEESVVKNAYNDSFKTLIADDNKLVAMPTIGISNNTSFPIPCYWMYNNANMYYVCLVVGVQYHRPTEEIRIYIDVRGEQDLRHPNTCSIQWKGDESNGPILQTKEFRARLGSSGNNNNNNSGRYQGYVSFDALVFDKPGTYDFLYADPRMDRAFFGPDYGSVPVLSVLPGPLEQSFEANNKVLLYTLENWSPFAMDGGGDDDTKEKADLERFRPFVYYLVWKRHNTNASLSRWWVEGEKRGGSVYASFVDSLAQN
mmetsp:Transcript_27256/g.54497  ORF Transcript_27256/g.54497 Transcript_27256/m.54497 type:complete len:312 (-) Transcript_27256:152-1087(-)